MQIKNKHKHKWYFNSKDILECECGKQKYYKNCKIYKLWIPIQGKYEGMGKIINLICK